MNIVTLVVPVVLLGVELARISFFELPAQADVCAGGVCTAPESEPAPPSIELVLRISTRGFELHGAAIDVTIPCVNGVCTEVFAYDFDALTQQLGRIKMLHPREDGITIVPEGLVPYQLVVLTMDATREDRLHPDQEGGCPELFPFAVVAAAPE